MSSVILYDLNFCLINLGELGKISNMTSRKNKRPESVVWETSDFLYEPRSCPSPGEN